MTTNIKICFVVGTLGRGGSERQLLYMLQALKNCGIDARVLCLTKGESFEQEIKSMGVPVDWIGKSKNRGARLLSIISNLKKNPVDIVQSSHFYTNMYVGLAGKFLNIPSIGAIRSDLLSVIGQHKFWGGWQLSLPSFLIVNSEVARQHTIEYGMAAEKIEFVRNAVEFDLNGCKKYLNSKPLIKILFVGRLDEYKRADYFIKLAAVLTKKFSELPLHFQIAGDGVLRTELEKLAQNLNLSVENLKFLGVCSDMSAVYKEADILISTSKNEGTSNVILEAMAHSLPVIATKVGGTPDIVNHNRGILIEPDNEDDLFKAAVALISDKELCVRLGSEGRKYVKENHSIENLQTQLVSIYKRLIG